MVCHPWRESRVSLRYNADSNLHLIIKVLCFKRQAVAVNSNRLTQSRDVCFSVSLVPRGELLAAAGGCLCVCFQKGQRCNSNCL